MHATAEIDTRTRVKTLTNVRRTATRIPDNSTRALHVTAITLAAASERVRVSCFLFVYALLRGRAVPSIVWNSRAARCRVYSGWGFI